MELHNKNLYELGCSTLELQSNSGRNGTSYNMRMNTLDPLVQKQLTTTKRLSTGPETQRPNTSPVNRGLQTPSPALINERQPLYPHLQIFKHLYLLNPLCDWCSIMSSIIMPGTSNTRVSFQLDSSPFKCLPYSSIHLQSDRSFAKITQLPQESEEKDSSSKSRDW